MRLKHEAPAYCCPYCLKPVGYIGRCLAWLFGTQIHQCDNLNDDSELARLRSRVECAEADNIRLNNEKMDMWERAFAAEKALNEARNMALEEAADVMELMAANYDRISENVWLTATAKRLYSSLEPKYINAASSIRSLKSCPDCPVDKSNNGENS